MNKNELIRKTLGFQEKINGMVMEYRLEHWLSLDLTIGQLKSLFCIQNRGKMSVRELAGELSVTPSVVTGIIDRLMVQGIVNRSGSTQDRRIQWLTLTDKGKGLLDGIKQRHIKEINEILNTLSDEDLSALFQGFAVFLKAIEAYLATHCETRAAPD